MAEVSKSKNPPAASEPLSPGDHLRLLIELLKPAGPELARRWLAALMVVPAEDRRSVVDAVERQIVSEYGLSADPDGAGPRRAGGRAP